MVETICRCIFYIEAYRELQPADESELDYGDQLIV